MPLDQQANAIDLSIFSYFNHIFLYPWIFTITASFWNSSTTFFSLLLVSPGVTTDSHARQNTSLIYLFFAVFSSQRRKTFLFLSNSFSRHNVSWKKSAQIKSHSLLAVGDLSTGLVFSHYLKTLSVKVHYCSKKISLLPRNFFIDTRKTEF